MLNLKDKAENIDWNCERNKMCRQPRRFALAVKK